MGSSVVAGGGQCVEITTQTGVHLRNLNPNPSVHSYPRLPSEILPRAQKQDMAGSVLHRQWSWAGEGSSITRRL